MNEILLHRVDVCLYNWHNCFTKRTVEHKSFDVVLTLWAGQRWWWWCRFLNFCTYTCCGAVLTLVSIDDWLSILPNGDCALYVLATEDWPLIPLFTAWLLNVLVAEKPLLYVDCKAGGVSSTYETLTIKNIHAHKFTETKFHVNKRQNKHLSHLPSSQFLVGFQLV